MISFKVQKRVALARLIEIIHPRVISGAAIQSNTDAIITMVRRLPFLYRTVFWLALGIMRICIIGKTSAQIDNLLIRWSNSRWFHKRILLKTVHCICAGNIYSNREVLEWMGAGASVVHRERRAS